MNREEQQRFTIAVDFDGTLCAHEFPHIGSADIDLIRALKEHRKDGCYLILWTCREGQFLQEAVDWCAKYGLEFDAVNENIDPDYCKRNNFAERKIVANLYVDDRGMTPTTFMLQYMAIARHLEEQHVARAAPPRHIIVAALKKELGPAPADERRTPELLEALRTVQTEIAKWRDGEAHMNFEDMKYCVVDAAIAKAEGRTGKNEVSTGHVQ